MRNIHLSTGWISDGRLTATIIYPLQFPLPAESVVKCSSVWPPVASYNLTSGLNSSPSRSSLDSAFPAEFSALYRIRSLAHSLWAWSRPQFLGVCR